MRSSSILHLITFDVVHRRSTMKVAGDSTQPGPFLPNSGTRVHRFFESMSFPTLYDCEHGATGIAGMLSGRHRFPPEERALWNHLERVRFGERSAEIVRFFTEELCSSCGIMSSSSTTCYAGPVEKRLRRCQCVVSSNETPSSVILLARNADVEAKNADAMRLLPSSRTQFKCVDSFQSDAPAAAREQLCRSAPADLCLKVGARVMLCRVLKQSSTNVSGNVGRKLLPGSLGTVISLFNCSDDFKRSCAVVAFDDAPQEPIHVYPMSFEVASPESSTSALASRMQLPLRLGYALTMTRSQGLTLQSIVVDFSSTDWCAPGMAYMALSRCPRRRHMRVIGLKPCHIRADKASIDFARMLPVWGIGTPTR